MLGAILAFSLLAAAPIAAQTPPPSALPPQTPIPGAPTGECSFPDISADTPVRITTGTGPIPYQFACGHNRPPGVCAINTVPPGLVVNLGPEQNGWACVTGVDSSGWIAVEHLAPIPATPQVPISEWLGWWRQGEDAKGRKNNRLLITHGAGSNVLHVSGRAYWYGIADNVHFGEVQADAAPIGVYLHAVEPAGGGGCVVDMKLNPASHTLNVYDNMQCGGMNVRFSRTWTHFTPRQHSK